VPWVGLLELMLAFRDSHVFTGKRAAESVLILQPVGGHYTLALYMQVCVGVELINCGAHT